MMQTDTILIVDDEPKIRTIIKDILQEQGYTVLCSQSGAKAFEFLKKHNISLILLDLKMPGLDGIEVLKRVQKGINPPKVIIITAHGSIEKAVESVQSGAFDFMEKPVEMERLLITVKNALRQRQLESENRDLKSQFEYEQLIIGESDSILKVRKLVEQASQADINVFITGENGTGKDLVAKNIHLNSKRKKHPFITINCAAIPINLIESELFGHEKGAFTGAYKRHEGRFENADNGTLFLNEIAEMSPETQAKLLQVIECGYVNRIGGKKEISVDVRLITATNINVTKAIRNQELRKDLFYRLNVFPIHLPPLKGRGGDIILLADHFLGKHICHHGTNLKTLSSEAKNILQNHYWPGNVRELNNLMEKLVVTVNKYVIQKEDILENLVTLENHQQEQIYSLRKARNKWEKEYIIKALIENNWVITKTADVLEIERTHLHRLINHLGVNKIKE